MSKMMQAILPATAKPLIVLAMWGLSAGVTVIAADAAPDLPACQWEDGNADGNPCGWTDPGTGVVYSVTSENYR